MIIYSYTDIILQNSAFWARREAEREIEDATLDRCFPEFAAWNKLRKANKACVKPSDLDTVPVQPPSTAIEVTQSDTKQLAAVDAPPEDDSMTESDPELQDNLKALREAKSDIERRVILDRMKQLSQQGRA